MKSIELHTGGSFTYQGVTYLKGQVYKDVDDTTADYLLKHSGRFKQAGTATPMSSEEKRMKEIQSQRNFIQHVPEPKKPKEPVPVILAEHPAQQPTTRKLIIKKKTNAPDVEVPIFRSKVDLYDYAKKEHGVELDNGPDAKMEKMRTQLFEHLSAAKAKEEAEDDASKAGAVKV